MTQIVEARKENEFGNFCTEFYVVSEIAIVIEPALIVFGRNEKIAVIPRIKGINRFIPTFFNFRIKFILGRKEIHVAVGRGGQKTQMFLIVLGERHVVEIASLLIFFLKTEGSFHLS